ncbi:MAG TPA: peptide ABC transporter substrate-binding protein [Candidatus Baltobacteraceae bacterium]
MLAFGGCTRAANNAATARPDTIVIAQQREPMSLNPALENGTSSTEWGLLLFSYLVKFNDKGELIGDAATAVPSLRNGGISPDGLTVTYHLRKGIEFADGTPLTAADAAWSVDAINDPANNVQSRYGYDDVAKAQAPDPSTLVLHLKKPFAPLLTLVLAPQGFPIFPKHLLATHPDFNHIPFDALPIGSGPYVVDRWLHGDRVEMHANPHYWQGKPKIEHLEIRFVADPNTAINLLKTREVDGYFSDLDFGNYPILKAVPGVVVTSTPVDAVGAIVFNTQDPLTSDARVRRALAEAMNVPALVAKSYRGALDSRAAGKGLFIWAYDAHAYPDIPYDPARARVLLYSAGWHLGPDKLRHRNGKTLDLLLIVQAATPGDQIIGSAIQQYERAVGVDVSLKQFNVTQFVAPADAGGPVYGGKFQMALYPFVNGDDPDTTDQFACANVPPHGYNKSRICEPRIDALLNAGRTTFDVAKRKAIYARLEEQLISQLPIALLYQRRELDAFSTRIHNQTTSLSTAFWNVGAWSLEK